MLDKLKNVSDKKYRLIAGILYAVLIPITLISFLSCLGYLTGMGMILYPALFISCILLSSGLLFQQDMVVFLGIISQLLAYVLLLLAYVLLFVSYLFFPCEWFILYLISIIICMYLLLKAFRKNGLSKLEWYITLFACPICFGIPFACISIKSGFILTVQKLNASFFGFRMHSIFPDSIRVFLVYLVYIFLIAAFFCLSMLVCKGSVHMSKSAAKKQPVAANTSNTIEELSKLKDLLDSGIITQEEFIEKKKQIIK